MSAITSCRRARPASPIEIVRYDLAHLDRALCRRREPGLRQAARPPGKDRLLGATIVAHNAGEMLAELVLAMKHGLGLNKILGTIHAYPTMAEANKYAAGEWKKAHKPERLLAWVERYHRLAARGDPDRHLRQGAGAGAGEDPAHPRARRRRARRGWRARC